MGMKGAIKADHIAKSRYEIIFAGTVPFHPTKVSGFDDETDSVELPDQTRASGGGSKPFDMTISIPAHHTVEIAAMELWLRQGRGQVSSAYKKQGTLIMKSISGGNFRSYTLNGCWVMKRTTPDLEMSNDGDLVEIEYVISVDESLPI